MKTLKRYLGHYLFGIIGLIAFIIIAMIDEAYTGFPAIMIESAIGVVGWHLIDKYYFKGVDTIEEIKKGNVSFSLIFLGYAVIIGAAILAN